ncbi:PSD1 and planctomycete cytochrome C domain-containing protein [Bremerella sp. JC770]|uniref:PSD1 and planctomycete cytochrome C domain-containing protein n=1 Tax=Bremerella sp. JC770 TaxID=3232137 RepID=UPI003457E0F7
MPIIPHRTLCIAFAVSLMTLGHRAQAEKPLDYNRDVRPILSENCFYCHGPDPEHREADLRFDDEEAAKDYAIVPGDLDSSEFFQRIIADPDSRMPPVNSGKKLSAKDIATLKRWIEEGAQYEKHWAYVPPEAHPVPEVNDKQWPESDIDRFLLAKMEAEDLKPSPAADKVTLLRRVTFDLTGLPPTIEQVDAFLKDESPDAYEKVVDRLLASDHYGERMAVYWLDLVRFADTVGYHGDQDHNISPYRDYVLDAFNANLPFDQFTREQLAGDLLPESTLDQKIASGYNRLLQTTHEGGLQEKEYLAIYAADRVRNVSQVWMGATVGCAQCHTHKYDPYTIDDFYSLAAFFADVDEAQHFKVGTNSVPTKRPPEIKVLSQRERAQLADLEAELAELSSDEQADVDRLQEQIDKLNASARMTMITESIKPREMRVLPRGNWLDDSGDIVQPAIPTFMGNVEAQQDRANRLDLANWLTDPQQGSGGLTARVFANRLWYLFYGVGLSASLGDFGGQGEPPVHPELLDYLAIDFYQHDWDVKHLVKTMVMTAAYKQSSFASEDVRQRDPYNRFYSHQTRHRLPAEMIRDNALAVSGLLNLEYGGPSVKPYQPSGYYRHLNFPQRKYREHQDERQWRRGVYVHWQRQFLHPSMKAFDAPSREECTVERPRSNTPLAALALLNDPTYIEAAREFATRILSSPAETDEARLNHAYMLALSRTPDSDEKDVLSQILDENREVYRQDTKAAAQLLEIGLKPSDDAIEVAELAAWTQVARVIFNLDEFITRN